MGAEERIDVNDPRAVERWAEALCTTPKELAAAVAAVGPGVEQVKRHLFADLMRRAGKNSEP